MKLKYGIMVAVIVLITVALIFFIIKDSPPSDKVLVPNSEQSVSELRKELEKAEKNDTDFDGLLNDEEERLGTNPQNPDTDGDGLLDGDEVKGYASDPRKADTDGDGVRDGKAVRIGKDPTGKTNRTSTKFVTTTVN